MSFGGQSNAWQSNIMQDRPRMNSFRQGSPQRFMQTPQQRNLVAFSHAEEDYEEHGMYTNSGGNRSLYDPHPRSGLDPIAFQGCGNLPPTHYNSIGTVTHINNDCGLVNNEVFFFRNVCKGPDPELGDRVIFEATYSTSGQFKWNATSIQLLQLTPPTVMNSVNNNYSTVDPQRRISPRRVLPLRVADVEGTVRHKRERHERERHHSRDREESNYSSVAPRDGYQLKQMTTKRESPIRGAAFGGIVKHDHDIFERKLERKRRHQFEDRDEDERGRKHRHDDHGRSSDRIHTTPKSRTISLRLYSPPPTYIKPMGDRKMSLVQRGSSKPGNPMAPQVLAACNPEETPALTPFKPLEMGLCDAPLPTPHFTSMIFNENTDQKSAKGDSCIPLLSSQCAVQTLSTKEQNQPFPTRSSCRTTSVDCIDTVSSKGEPAVLSLGRGPTTSSVKTKEEDQKREQKAKVSYRRSCSFLRRFVGKDMALLSGKEKALVRKHLGYVGRFEKSYPHLPAKSEGFNSLSLPEPLNSMTKTKEVASKHNAKKVNVSPPGSSTKPEPSANLTSTIGKSAKRARSGEESLNDAKRKKKGNLGTDPTLQVAIIDRGDRDGRITPDRWLLIEDKLMDAMVDKDCSKNEIDFSGADWFKGVKIVECANRETLAFLKCVIDKLGEIWPGAKLSVVPQSSLLRRQVVSVWIPPPSREVERILQLLGKLHDDLHTELWEVISTLPCQKKKGFNMKATVDNESLAYLRSCGGRVKFGLGNIYFRGPGIRERNETEKSNGGAN